MRLSVRTAVSRIDITLPASSTFAEVLETVLDLCPPSLRDNALGHGGWILRTAAGRRPHGESTLAAAGVLDGATLFLVGIDPRPGGEVYDDIADAVAENVRDDQARWPAGVRRAVALEAAGLFAAVAIVPLLLSGAPWLPITLLLAAGTAVAQVGAGLLSRMALDAGAAVVAGLISVVTGAAAAAVVTAGRADLLHVGTTQLLLGALAGTMCATTATVIIGTGSISLAAVITGGLLTVFSLSGGMLFDLPPSGCAAITVGFSMSAMPLVPGVALRWAGIELLPSPTTLEDLHADSATVDGAEIGWLTRRAVDGATAMIQGLAWPTVAAATVLAFSDDLAARVLAGVVAAGLILRSRLFVTTGQRHALLLAGTGSTAALMLAVIAERAGSPGMPWSAAPPALASVVCLYWGIHARGRSPAVSRAAEIADLVLTIAVVPLVLGVLGVFGLIAQLTG